MAGSAMRLPMLAWAALLGSRAAAEMGVASLLPVAMPATGKVLRISCVGDSLTEGYHASDRRRSYPSVLQGLLGPGYFVMNFGHSGSTLTGPQAGFPDKIVYSHTAEYTSSLQSEPDIVIIMIGSNDATSMVWPQFHQDFEPAYTKLVGVYQALPTQPLVFVVVPPPLYKEHAYGMMQSVINSDFPAALLRIAGVKRLPPPISVFEAFKSQCPDLISNSCPLISGAAAPHNAAHDDGCHPNDAGYSVMAQTVQAAVLPLAKLMMSSALSPSATPAVPDVNAGLPAAFGAMQAAGADFWAKRRRRLVEEEEAGSSDGKAGSPLLV